MSNTQSFTDAVALSHTLRRLSSNDTGTAVSRALIQGCRRELAKLIAGAPELVDQLAIEHGIDTDRERFFRFLTGE